MKEWYLIITKPQKEFFVEKALKENLKDLEVYCPKRLKKGKLKSFFPNYLFVKFDKDKYFHTIKYTMGVKSIFMVDGEPIKVPEEIIKKIRENEENGVVKIRRHSGLLKKGDRVRIEEGALEGIEGIFHSELKDSERIRILVSSILVITQKEKISKIG